MRHRLPLLTLLALLLLTLAACGSVPAVATPAPPTLSSLPGITLATLTGDQVDVAGVTRGRVAVVSLWATWCDACKKEMDALNRLNAKTGADAIVIGVAVGEDREKVAEFSRRRGLQYVQLVDTDFAFSDAIGQRRVPATLVVDRHGHIVFRGEALDVASLEALRRTLAGTL